MLCLRGRYSVESKGFKIERKRKKMKIVYAGGGTGGHINPALSIADYVKQKDKNSEALFDRNAPRSGNKACSKSGI